MIRAAIVGLGTWGQNLVRAVQGPGVEPSPHIRFTAAASRTPASMHSSMRCRQL